MQVNRAKIVATVGPACSDRETLRAMIQSGVNVCRINFSHQKSESAHEVIEIIRDLNRELGSNVAILADLQGPKLRVGEMEDGSYLKEGDYFELSTVPMVGNSSLAYVSYEALAQDVKVGETILLDDGKIILEVMESNGVDRVKTVVRFGGLLTSRKGVNLPNTALTLPSLTSKDLADVQVAIAEKVEWIALSFVRKPSDIEELREIILQANCDARLISKIEKPQAIKCIDDIILKSDGLMVARGDLGVEMPLEEVPDLQKMMVAKCRAASKPVIIATQMMESMTSSIRPTRAEVSDVANSVLDGADALMLSGETSVGMHPVEVVEAMARIISRVEKGNAYQSQPHEVEPSEARSIPDAVCYQACNLATQMKASALVTMTHSGYSGFKVSSYRPDTSIFVFTRNRVLLNTLSLLWGVRGFYYDGFVSTDDSIQDIHDILLSEGLVKSGDLVVNITSMPIEARGMTNMVKLTLMP